jgi:hypothetical protein
MSYEKDVEIVERALRRQHRAGVDVGEFLVTAVVAAQTNLRGRPGDMVMHPDLTSNRYGSWEAALLQQMIEAGGG